MSVASKLTTVIANTKRPKRRTAPTRVGLKLEVVAGTLSGTPPRSRDGSSRRCLDAGRCGHSHRRVLVGRGVWPPGLIGAKRACDT